MRFPLVPRRRDAGVALYLLLAAGCAGAASPAAAGPLDPFFPSGGPFGPGAVVLEPRGRLTPPQVVDIVYARYGAARVMTVRNRGGIYEVDAIDRRGRRVRYTLDSLDGELLEREM